MVKGADPNNVCLHYSHTESAYISSSPTGAVRFPSSLRSGRDRRYPLASRVAAQQGRNGPSKRKGRQGGSQTRYSVGTSDDRGSPIARANFPRHDTRGATANRGVSSPNRESPTTERTHAGLGTGQERPIMRLLRWLRRSIERDPAVDIRADVALKRINDVIHDLENARDKLADIANTPRIVNNDGRRPKPDQG